MQDKFFEISYFHHHRVLKQFLSLKFLQTKSLLHGAASAPINQDQLHYLMSRGLSNHEATSMIVEGFLVDSFTGLESDHVRESMQTRLTVH